MRTQLSKEPGIPVQSRDTFCQPVSLLDDIASVLDDVAVLTKLAAKKTTGVLGDDLALNAEQVAGVHTERELPVCVGGGQGLPSQQS